MIQLFHVYKSYGQSSPALVDINLEVEKGDFVFLAGGSGAGKSTLLKLIFAAEKPSRGQLLINGRNIARLPGRSVPYLRRNIGVVFQDFKLLPRRTVEENVAVALEVLGTSKRTIRSRVYGVLKQVGLAHKLHELPPQLSGGEQQRVAIARALVNEPQILLADEPTGNLDTVHGDEVMRALTDLNEEGTTIVMVTHSRYNAEYGHRIIRLLDGKVVAESKLRTY